ncbi:GNAT family N-acetyltransferase [Janibacter sp. Soil728]|uniref:GNAT family N-acetyltransferase n=1 Tax=Janibacter sp. Soil728 TaxID=1736393 RepID=UPI00138F8D2F|nr:GNAT family N-acetyltransferase [Janibacter sp. Soil728]
MTPPRLITADDLSLRPPVEDDAQLVAELMDVPISTERPAQIVRLWREHWDERGYGTWIIEDPAGRRLGFVGLRSHSDFIRVTIRVIEGEGGDDLATRALRVVVSHALEWLPDLPLRIRLAPEDVATREVAEAAGMTYAPDLDHAVDGDEWQVLELPYVRIADRVPPRAREAMLKMWGEVNDAGGAVGFVPGASQEDVAEVLDGYVARLAEGRTVCVALNSPLGELLGFGFVARSTGMTVAHTANLERIMTDTARRGTNHGALLMAGMHRAAREMGVELVTLDYRGGTGLGEFYTRYGYTEVGRIPGGVRVAPGDDRDGVIMARSL